MNTRHGQNRNPRHGRSQERSSAQRLVAALTALVLGATFSPRGLGQSGGPLFEELTFSHLPTADLMGFSMDASTADVDGDGALDIVIASEFRPNILLLGDGEGRFTNASSDRLPRVSRDSEDVAIADFDGDGDLDIVIVSEDDRVNELYLNDGRGFFVDASERLPVTGRSNAVVSTDLDGDSRPDILIGNNGQNAALISDGEGGFRDETEERLPRRNDITQDLELGDVDGDGDLDLLVGNEDRNRLLLNDGLGVFTDESEARLPVPAAPEETREADLGDIDGDGDLDILFANVRLFVSGAVPQNRLLINDGGGFFTDATEARLPDDEDLSMDGDFIDIDHDGDLDILTANFDDLAGRRASAPYRAYRNDGRGFFEEATADVFPPGVVGNGLDIEAADFDGDGGIDLYLASRGGVDRLLRTINVPRVFRRADANLDGRVDISDSVTVLLQLVGGTGILCADAADSNDDGVVNLADAVHAASFLFAAGDAPPAPGPLECGVDPTMDALACAKANCLP